MSDFGLPGSSKLSRTGGATDAGNACLVSAASVYTLKPQAGETKHTLDLSREEGRRAVERARNKEHAWLANVDNS